MKTKKDFASYGEWMAYADEYYRSKYPISEYGKAVRKEVLSKHKRSVEIKRNKDNNAELNRSYLMSLGVSSYAIHRLMKEDVLSSRKWNDIPMEVKVILADEIINDEGSSIESKLSVANEVGKSQKVIYNIVKDAKDLAVDGINEEIISLIRVAIKDVAYGRITITTHEEPRRNLYLWDKDNNRINHSKLR